MSNLHDHLWIDIFQHTHVVAEQDEKRIWRYRHHLILFACRHGSMRVVNAMVASGADVNNICDKYGQTPLHTASFWCCVEVVEMLLTAGADVNARNNSGQTPLSASKCQTRQILLAAGAIE